MIPVFEAESLSFSYPLDSRPALREVSVRVEAGSFFTIIGPNGSGKSTLLKLFLGALQPASGRVLFEGVPTSDWDRRAFARRVGAVPQIEEMVFPFTVRELVAMGRYPHLGPWRREAEADRQAIERALEMCDLSGYASRNILRLSGGERQRARVARALAQQPATLALDEPNAALDIGHEMALFELLFQLCKAQRATIVAATHNINLAARFATHMLLLADGAAVAWGAPAEVLQSARIEEVYRWPVTVIPHPGPGHDRGAPQVIPLAKE